MYGSTRTMHRLHRVLTAAVCCTHAVLSLHEPLGRRARLKQRIMIGLTHPSVCHDEVGNTITPDMGRKPPRPHFGLFAAAAATSAEVGTLEKKHDSLSAW